MSGQNADFFVLKDAVLVLYLKRLNYAFELHRLTTLKFRVKTAK